jgi:hypothetical protein
MNTEAVYTATGNTCSRIRLSASMYFIAHLGRLWIGYSWNTLLKDRKYVIWYSHAFVKFLRFKETAVDVYRKVSFNVLLGMVLFIAINSSVVQCFLSIRKRESLLKRSNKPNQLHFLTDLYIVHWVLCTIQRSSTNHTECDSAKNIICSIMSEVKM